MDLYKSNPKGRGSGVEEGSKRDKEKNKWLPHIKWVMGPYGEEEWRSHLAGIEALGLGPNLDDGTAYWGCMDIDKIGSDRAYEVDYTDEMIKITRSGFPVVVDVTKSGGLRLTVYFTEPVPCEDIRTELTRWMAQLGYSKNEIFPKQNGKLENHDDCPSWVFMSYGPTWDKCCEQYCLTETGNAMGIEESLALRERIRMTREQFMEFGAAKKTTNGSGHKNRKQSGLWSQCPTFEETLDDTFKNGPICLWHIAHEGCSAMQHNFLFNVAIFLKRKYPDNWDDALAWVNYNVLKPSGNRERLDALIKDFKNREYEYRCKDEPICSHCNASACRRMPYGVGNGKTGIDHYELGMTIVNRKPTIYYVNVGDVRMALMSEDLMRLARFREKCMAMTRTFPDNMKQAEWDAVVRRAVDEATIVEPYSLMQSDVNEIEVLEMYFQLHIPNEIRRSGTEYREGKVGEAVRIRLNEEMIYFKWKGLMGWCRRALSMRNTELEKLRLYIMEHGREIKRDEMRDWYRSTYVIPMNLLDSMLIQKWLETDAPSTEGG